ncbi:biotin--[acetyl-CoA-carboxylase] ligase [Nordella sp. HKS 07]|uniref:biotin--[acetyl-CoA-carboxylase] ligase n=1 Tax=Nordella sp. HKS 07 TaxID=2712222 RepID=UPI0013E14D59|nr:biotin--[acetyl-CoA-carboxylase] ligase [Nordella sp. HKS 07]QIG50870.1 biotin--[acetyl-CoA-carboxylase] ligase [Nordella sp. HKS 07]
MGLAARLLHFEAIDSTNAEAHRLAKDGECGPLWIVADLQSQGRGRLGRHWVSEPGNLYSTFVLALQGSALTASQIGFVAALAIRDTALALLPKKAPPVTIKWPNDVQVGGAKFAGILAETVAQSNDGRIIVALGMGLNLAHAPQGTPYPVTALARHGAHATPRKALDLLDDALSQWLSVWKEGQGFAEIRANWRKDAAGLGEEFSATVNHGELRGRFEDLGDDGAMILRLTDGSRKSIHSGEVQVRRA